MQHVYHLLRYPTKFTQSLLLLYLGVCVMGKNLTRSTLALAVVGAMSSFAMANESLTTGAEKDTTQLQTIVLTAEEQVKQSLGASIITDKDLEKWWCIVKPLNYPYTR